MIRFVIRILIQCNVLNKAKWIFKPNDVKTLNVESETCKALVLRWSEVEETFYDPISYEVEIQRLSTKKWEQIYSGTNTELIYSRLKSAEKGFARVRVWNSEGKSKWSKSVAFETRQTPVKQGGFGPNKVYKWDQNSRLVNVQIPLPANTKSRDVDLRYDSKTIFMSLKRDVVFQGTFHEKVKSDSPSWTIDDDGDGRVINLFLEKQTRSKRRVDLWPCLLKGHPKIDMGLVFHNAGVPTQFFPGDEEIKCDDDYFPGMG